jgi:hypothetical protein
MRSETGVSWLDAAVSKANVPQTVDTETAIEIHLRITGKSYPTKPTDDFRLLTG